MIINHNMMAMNTKRQMGVNQGNSAKSIEKLSSGMRINRAGDDAAGLAISEKMRGQIRGLNQASRNSQDGISMIQTAEGALTETHSILQRMRELAVQGANDTLADKDRGEIQNEINQLTSEINRIGNTTEFNTKSVLDGGEDARTNATSTTTKEAAALTAIAAVAGEGTAATAAKKTADADLGGSVAFDTATKITIAGEDVALTDVKALGAAYDAKTNKADVVTALQADIDNVAALKDKFKVSTDGDKLVITSVETGAAADVDLTGSDVGTGGTLLGITTLGSVKGADASTDYKAGTAAGDQFTVEAPKDGKKYTYSIAGEDLEVEGADAKAMAASLKDKIEGNAALKDNYTVTVEDDKVTIAKTPANTSTDALAVKVKELDASESGAEFTKDSKVTNGTTSTAGESALDVSSHENATNAIDVLQTAIEKVSSERSKLGSMQNRLEHTIKNLDTSSENLQAAESRIRDVDMAKEMMEFQKNNILSQAAQSMLAQANQAPQGVLQLLR